LETLRSYTTCYTILICIREPNTNLIACLYVLHFAVTNEEFRIFFEQFGQVIDSLVMFDRDTHRSRGFGFVTFEDPEISRHLLTAGDPPKGDPSVGRTGRIEMRGKLIEIKCAEPKESTHRRYAARDNNNNDNRAPHSVAPTVNTDMMMYGYPDYYNPNYYYYNSPAPGMYYPVLADPYMMPMYYPEQPMMHQPRMDVAYQQPAPMDYAYGYNITFPSPYAVQQPITVMHLANPGIPVKEAEEVDGVMENSS
jgi:hypothetical protein